MSLMRFTTSVSLAILVLPTLYPVPCCPGNVASLTLRLVQGCLIRSLGFSVLILRARRSYARLMCFL